MQIKLQDKPLVVASTFNQAPLYGNLGAAPAQRSSLPNPNTLFSGNGQESLLSPSF